MIRPAPYEGDTTMYCRFCGEAVGIGAEHVCPKQPVRSNTVLPPGSFVLWQLLGWGTALGFVAAIASWFGAYHEYSVTYHGLQSLANGTTYLEGLGPAESAADNGDAFALLFKLLVVVCLLGCVAWYAWAPNFLARLGERGRRALPPALKVLWWLTFAVATVLCVTLFVGSRTMVTGDDYQQLAHSVMHSVRYLMVVGTLDAVAALILAVLIPVVMTRMRSAARTPTPTAAVQS
jgi:hypothetical protein